MSSLSKGISEWALYRDLWRGVVERTTRPLRHPSFVAFFILAVFGLGASGVWLELYVLVFPDRSATSHFLHYPGAPSRFDALRTAMITFFTAVSGTSAMQLIWAEDFKHFRSASALILFLFLVVALLIFPARICDCAAISVGALMSLLALWVWWVANAKQADLLDRVDPRDAVGGKTSTPLSGSTSGWNT